jgi:phenylpyruvate tautomerase PptA (4-oxalocrotonate tautomerase family)
MPLIRISHAAGKSEADSTALSQGVHRALVDAFGIPEDDFFQIVTEHVPAKGLLYPKSFLGIDHGDEVVFVQVTAAEGRSTDQKKALYKAIVDNIERDAGVPRQDVIINIVETKRENWSFGNGAAPFA